jgi:hypothetical protein
MRNFSFQYEYSVQRTRNAAGRRVKNDVRRKVIKRNTTTFSKLPPGTYKASYRATINKRVNGTVSRVGVSKRSPTYNFQVR